MTRLDVYRFSQTNCISLLLRKHDDFFILLLLLLLHHDLSPSARSLLIRRVGNFFKVGSLGHDISFCRESRGGPAAAWRGL